MSLTRIPPAERRRMAFTLLPVAGALLVVGLLPLATPGPVGWKVVGAAVMMFASGLLGVSLGLRRTAGADESRAYEAAVDSAIMAAAPCGSNCGAVAAGGGCGSDDCAVKALPRLP